MPCANVETNDAVVTTKNERFAQCVEFNAKDPVVNDSTIVLNGENIGYCTYGTGDTKFIFICGGVGSYKKDFPEFILKYFDSSFYTIFCIDPPGYGTSRPPKRKQEVNRCLKDALTCKSLMENLNVDSYFVLGWSEGSRTAVHLADIAKRRVLGLVLLAASTRIDRRMTEVFKGLRDIDLWIPERLGAYLEHYCREFVREHWANLCDHLIQVYEELGGRFPSDFLLQNIKIPVLVLSGAQDKICNDNQYFTANLSNCRADCHMLGGHDFYLKHPKWFYRRVDDFVLDTRGNTKQNKRENDLID